MIVGEDEALRTTTFEVEDVNWISIEEPAAPLRAQVKIRHKHEPASATVEALPGHRARITFDTPNAPSHPAKAP